MISEMMQSPGYLMQYREARWNMVHKQVKTWQVSDNRILEVMAALPREHFVDSLWKPFAYMEKELPLPHAQVMLAPTVIGRLLQAIQPEAFETVLEVGTGSGYLTALLALLTKEITSIEIFPELSHVATRSLQSMSLKNTQLFIGDASLGWPKKAPYHLIVLTGTLPYLPETLYQQLHIHGRLIGFIGTPSLCTAVLVKRMSETQWTQTMLFETAVPSLIHKLPVSVFQF